MAEFDPAGLIERWERARWSALRSVTSFKGVQNPGSEAECVHALSDNEWEQASERVFLNSRALAQSASRYFGVQLSIHEFKDLLKESQVPCTQGKWAQKNDALVVETTQCPLENRCSSRSCIWFREAIDGIVMGLGQEERYVRHSSLAYGDQSCLDILFTDGPDSKSINFGPIPKAFYSQLEELKILWEQKGYRVEWKGYQMGVLFYEFLPIANSASPCGEKPRGAQKHLETEVKIKFPTLKLQDTSPVAVYGENNKNL